MKTLVDYQSLAGKTDATSINAAKAGYYFAGGSEEASEILEKMVSVSEQNTKEDNKGLVLELGDRMWYAVRNIFSLADCIPLRDMEDIDTMEETCTANGTAIKFDIKALSLLVNSIVILSGRISGLHKRMLRDYEGYWSIEKKSEVCEAEKQIIYLIVKASHAAGYSFRETLELNIYKLASRKSRGTIQGQGDYR